jgi:hypothetical protein
LLIPISSKRSKKSKQNITAFDQDLTFDNGFALIHFESEVDASAFYYVYCIQKKLICKRLKGIAVNPSLLDNKPINYVRIHYLLLNEIRVHLTFLLE